MNHRSPNRDAMISALSRAGWNRISDRIVHGLCHDLSGRASSLTGLTYLLECGDEGASSLLPHVSEELGHMEDVIRLLRLLPDDATEPELIAPGEILEDLALLVKVQRGLEDVPVQVRSAPGAPAVRMDRTAFIRSLTLVLTRAAERSASSGGRGVEATMAPEGGRLVLEVTPAPWEGKGSPDEGGEGPLGLRTSGGASMETLGEALHGVGIEAEVVSGTDGGRALRMRYPSPAFS